MASSSRQHNDYTRERVPDQATVSGVYIAIVILGAGITLPVFFVGSQLSSALGFKAALTAFAASCFGVGVLMAICSIIGARTRMSTYLLLEFSFGQEGAKIVNLLLAVTLIGYFSATADIFGGAIKDAIEAFFNWHGPKFLFTLFGCVAMTLTAIFGFRVVERFSIATVPLLAGFMLYVVYVTLQQGSWSEVLSYKGSGEQSFGIAVSTIVGVNILSAVLAPDFTRYARNDKAALISILGLVIGYPVIMLASGIPTIISGETDIMKIMIGLGLTISALYLLVIATWTTNTLNLYSSVLTMATVFTRQKTWKLGLWASAIGTTGAVLGLMTYFLPFVLFLGVTTTPIAGIYIADFFFVKHQRYDLADLATAPAINHRAFIAWIAGSVVGLLSTQDMLTVTNISALDSLSIAFLTYLLLAKLPFVRSG